LRLFASPGGEIIDAGVFVVVSPKNGLSIR
jgi:hypothetical protein